MSIPRTHEQVPALASPKIVSLPKLEAPKGANPWIVHTEETAPAAQLLQRVVSGEVRQCAPIQEKLVKELIDNPQTVELAFGELRKKLGMAAPSSGSIWADLSRAELTNLTNYLASCSKVLPIESSEYLRFMNYGVTLAEFDVHNKEFNSSINNNAAKIADQLHTWRETYRLEDEEGRTRIKFSAGELKDLERRRSAVESTDQADGFAEHRERLTRVLDAQHRNVTRMHELHEEVSKSVLNLRAAPIVGTLKHLLWLDDVASIYNNPTMSLGFRRLPGSEDAVSALDRVKTHYEKTKGADFYNDLAPFLMQAVYELADAKKSVSSGTK